MEITSYLPDFPNFRCVLDSQYVPVRIIFPIIFPWSMPCHGIWCRVLAPEALRLIRLDWEVAQLAVAHQALHEFGAGAEARLGLGQPWSP